MAYRIRKHLGVINEDEVYLKEQGLYGYYKGLLEVIKQDPAKIPPRFHHLLRELKPCLSRDLTDDSKYHTLPDRLVYKVDEGKKEVIVFSARLHYVKTERRIGSEWMVPL